MLPITLTAPGALTFPQVCAFNAGATIVINEGGGSGPSTLQTVFGDADLAGVTQLSDLAALVPDAPAAWFINSAGTWQWWGNAWH